MKRLIVLVVTAGAFACSNPQEEAELLIDAMVERAEAGGEALRFGLAVHIDCNMQPLIAHTDLYNAVGAATSNDFRARSVGSF
ncbi:MAG: hypothetical protein EBZ26_07665 [Flavobacteriia bacterium]|nr:hypothetical protein [Flavobacteriia bacterium]